MDDGFDYGNTYDLCWQALRPADLVGTEIRVVGGDFMAADEIQIRYSLQNSGPGPADDVAVQFYISTDATIDPNTDRPLGPAATIGRLDPGEATGLLQRTATLPRPGETWFWEGDGTYYVGRRQPERRSPFCLRSGECVRLHTFCGIPK